MMVFNKLAVQFKKDDMSKIDLKCMITDER